jgi:putative iron-dependent peroxidase
MTPQSAIFEPIPPHARHLFFDLNPSSAPRASLRELAAHCDGHTVVMGLGSPIADALGINVPGLRGFPELPAACPPVPATQHAVWLWLRGQEAGDLLLAGHALSALLADAFILRESVACFRHQDFRDLTGYIDGTENPQDQAAIEAALLPNGKMAGSSFAAVQLWQHDFDKFNAMPQAEQDDTFGRRRSDNEELENAPESAHVKRTAQEDFDPEAFVVRRSMPWIAGADAGFLFLAFGKSFDAFEAQLRRMTGHDDGITDALFKFTRPLTGGYYWCPPLMHGRIDLSVLDCSV